jgi:hypothetical protein
MTIFRECHIFSNHLIHSQTMQDIVRSVRVILYIPVWSDDMRRLQVILSDCADVWAMVLIIFEICVLEPFWTDSINPQSFLCRELRLMHKALFAYVTGRVQEGMRASHPLASKIVLAGMKLPEWRPGAKALLHSIRSGEHTGWSWQIWAKECKKWIKHGASGCVGFDMNRIDSIPLEDTQSHDNLCRSISTQCISIANVYQMSILRECFWNISTYIKMYQQIHHDISWYHVACKEIQLVPASKWKTSWIASLPVPLHTLSDLYRCFCSFVWFDFLIHVHTIPWYPIYSLVFWFFVCTVWYILILRGASCESCSTLYNIHFTLTHSMKYVSDGLLIPHAILS